MPALNSFTSFSTIARRVRWKAPPRPPRLRSGVLPMKPTMPTAMPTAQLINELQSYGVRLVDPKAGHESRRGGAGPSDHKAMTIDGMTVMVPVHTAPAFESPYFVDKPDALGRSRVSRDGVMLGEVSFPVRPRFYDRVTADGIPYWKIAVLHSRDVLATTVLQTRSEERRVGKECRSRWSPY